MRFALVALVAGCALHDRAPLGGRPVARDFPAAGGSSEIAVASWYGREFHGRRTASGEVFDQHGLSAAHPSLPLGTRVRVTSLESGESVDVRITDRGPFVRGRTLDLSYGAARRLRMVEKGTDRVRIEVLKGTASRERVGTTLPATRLHRRDAGTLTPMGKSARAARDRRGMASVKPTAMHGHRKRSARAP